MAITEFDYENDSTLEGQGTISPASRDLAGMRLQRCVIDMPLTEGWLLEVGCGVGRHARSLKLLRPRLKVHGCDLSRRALRLARSEHDGVSYACADAQVLPYRDESFDAVVFFDILEHLPDVASAVREISRVLRPGGVVHGFVPCEANPGTIFRRLLGSDIVPVHRWKREHVGHIQALTTNDVVGELKSVDLQITGVSFSFHTLGQIYDILDYWKREQGTKGGPPAFMGAPLRLVLALFWRLSYYEAMVRKHSPRAVGLHVTAVKSKV